MVKKFLLILSLLATIIFLVGHASAQSSSAPCILGATLVNQDPYPAVPGDYVKVVFKLTGLENPNCKNVFFELVQDYPFSLDPGVSPKIDISGGTFVRDYASFVLIPFKLRVDETALDGENEIEVTYTSSGKSAIRKKFVIWVKDERTNFEVSIKDYVPETRTLTFEILNIGKGDAQALTVEVPKQKNIEIKGSNKDIIGNLDAYEDTSFSYEAIPQQGYIDLKISYTDKNNVRRELNKTVYFDPTYFNGRVRDAKTKPTNLYVGALIIIIIIILWLLNRIIKNINKRKQIKENSKR